MRMHRLRTWEFAFYFLASPLVRNAAAWTNGLARDRAWRRQRISILCSVLVVGNQRVRVRIQDSHVLLVCDVCGSMHEKLMLDPNQNSDILRVYFFSICGKRRSSGATKNAQMENDRHSRNGPNGKFECEEKKNRIVGSGKCEMEKVHY